MNQVIENILTRQSTRAFNDQMVSREHMEILAETAIYAPTGMGRQTWQITCMQSATKLAELIPIMREFTNENYCFYNAKSFIIVSNSKENAFGRDDDACALQNIFLAAHSLDICSVWINQLTGDNCDRPKVREFLTSIGVPVDHVVHGVAALGYSDNKPTGKKEKTGKIVFVD